MKATMIFWNKIYCLGDQTAADPNVSGKYKEPKDNLLLWVFGRFIENPDSAYHVEQGLIAHTLSGTAKEVFPEGLKKSVNKWIKENLYITFLYLQKDPVLTLSTQPKGWSAETIGMACLLKKPGVDTELIVEREVRRYGRYLREEADRGRLNKYTA